MDRRFRDLYADATAYPSQPIDDDGLDTVTYSSHQSELTDLIDADGGSRVPRQRNAQRIQRLQQLQSINPSIHQSISRPQFTSVFDSTYQYASSGSLFDTNFNDHSQSLSQLYEQPISQLVDQSTNEHVHSTAVANHQLTFEPSHHPPPSQSHDYSISDEVSILNSQDNQPIQSVKPEPPAKQRLSSATLISDDDFFSSNAIETPRGQLQVERNKSTKQSIKKAEDRERKERAMVQNVTESKQRSRKQPPAGFKEFNLMSLTSKPKSRSAAKSRGLSSFIERDLVVVKQEQLSRVAEIEEVEIQPKREPSASQSKHSWKCEVDAEFDSLPVQPVRSDDLGTRRKFGQGELESKLQLAIRRRESQITTTRHQLQQKQLVSPSQLNNQSVNQLLRQQPVNANNETLSVTVKVLESVQHFSQLFLICLICSPYRPPGHSANQLFNQPVSQSLASVPLPSLESYATRLNVPVSSFAVLVFSRGRRHENLFTDRIQLNYYRMFFPWFDISNDMCSPFPIITDPFDFLFLAADIGAQDERDERSRLTRLDGSKESSMSEDEPFPTLDDEEFIRQKEDLARRAVFGDLNDVQIIDLFATSSPLCEDTEMNQLQSVLAVTPVPAQSSTDISQTQLSDYQRPKLSSLKPYTSLWRVCIAGVIQRVSLRGHSLKESDSRLAVSRPVSILIDDGTAVVQIDIPHSCLARWRDVLMNELGSVVWMGGLSMSDRNAIDTFERNGSSSMSAMYNNHKPVIILQVMETTRFHVQKQSNDPHALFSNVKLHSSSFTSLSDTLRLTSSTRIHVCARVIHAVFDANDSAVVWLTDSSLLPLSTAVRAPCSTPSICVLVQSYFHIQLLRSFLHCDDPSSRCIVVRDLSVEMSEDDESNMPEFSMDDFTDIMLATTESINQSNNQSTSQVNETPPSTSTSISDIIERHDPFGSPHEMLALPRVHVASSPIFSQPSNQIDEPIDALLPLSAVLHRPPADDPCASPLLLKHGVFLIDGLILDVVSACSRCLFCSYCGHEGMWYDLRDSRPSVRAAISTFCYRCAKVQVMQVSGRVSVEMKNRDLVQTFRAQLPPNLLRQLLPESAFADQTNNQSTNQSINPFIPHNVLVGALKTKRVSFVARAQHSDMTRSVKLPQLPIIGLVPWKDRRI